MSQTEFHILPDFLSHVRHLLQKSGDLKSQSRNSYNQSGGLSLWGTLGKTGTHQCPHLCGRERGIGTILKKLFCLLPDQWVTCVVWATLSCPVFHFNKKCKFVKALQYLMRNISGPSTRIHRWVPSWVVEALGEDTGNGGQRVVFRQLAHFCWLCHHGHPRLHPPGLHDVQGFEQPGGEEINPGPVPPRESQLREDFKPPRNSFLEEEETQICWTLVCSVLGKYVLNYLKRLV